MIKGKVAFIGTGNMGGAMLRGAVEKQAAKRENIYIYDAYEPLVKKLTEELGVKAAESESDAAKNADYIIVAVKPDKVAGVWEKISPVCKGKTIISIAAGKKLADYEGNRDGVKFVRTIPNLPAMVGEGITGLYFDFDTEKNRETVDDVKEIFESFGKTIVVEKEEKIDSMISVTSSSPAYVCLMVEAMADAAVKAGFKRKDAYMMAEQAIYGTCAYLMEKEILPAALKDMVCSPGGTTIEAVAVLEKEGFRAALMDAMQACEEKNRKLGKK